MSEPLSYVTAGESHGPELTVIMSGLPSGLAITADRIDSALGRRQRGYGRSPRQKMEQDTARVTSGIRHGVTLGSPIAMHITNRDHANWDSAMSVWPTSTEQGNWRDRPITVPRPGHADLGGVAQHGFMTGGGEYDARNVLERASARETAARVAAGSLSLQFLNALGIQVRSRVRAIGSARSALETPPTAGGWEHVESSEVGCLDAPAEAKMIAELDAAKAKRDTLGGEVEVVVYGLPPGFGSYARPDYRLDALLARAAVAVQAIKAVEIGDGFAISRQPGSAVHDQMYPDLGAASQGMGVTRSTNRAGGVEGGMSNGAPLVVRAFMKPLPTLMQPLDSVDFNNHEPVQAHAERSDVCAVPAAAVVLEFEVAHVVAQVLRRVFGMPALADIQHAFNAYCERVAYRVNH